MLRTLGVTRGISAPYHNDLLYYPITLTDFCFRTRMESLTVAVVVVVVVVLVVLAVVVVVRYILRHFMSALTHISTLSGVTSHLA